MSSVYTVQFLDIKNQQTLWEIQVDNLDLVAGMLAAGLGITEELNYKETSERPGDPRHIYVLDSDADVSEYRLIQESLQENILTNSLGQLTSDFYGIWVASSVKYRYNLYQFSNAAFFQGIITICNHFGVDFRNYLYGLIFDSDGKDYTLDGYMMTDYPLVVVVTDASDADEDERSSDEENQEDFDTYRYLI